MTMEYPWTSQDKDNGHWQLSSSPPARLNFTGSQGKPALSFIRNQTKEQNSCSGRGRNPSTMCIYTSFLCLFFTLTAEGEEPGVPHTPHGPHWGNHPEQTCSKASPATCDGKGHLWTSDCSTRLLFISHEETITALQGKPRLPFWKRRNLEKPRDLSTEVRHTPMGKVLSSWYRESSCACKHLITLHLPWSPLLKSCFNSPTAAS